jgi:hypothetical protein
MNKKELINEITEHFPSVYTKEDVVKLINLLDDTRPKIDVEELKQQIRRKIERLSGDEVVDFDSIHLSLSGREIYIDDISVNHDVIVDEVNDIIDEYFDDKEVVHDEE